MILLLCRNPILKGESHRRLCRMLLSSGAIFPVKKLCENSGTPEPAASPDIPHFPQSPNFRGHNSEKCGTGAGIIQRFPTGTDEVEYSNVTKTESRMDVVWVAAGTGRGIFQHPPREASGIKRNSTEEILYWFLLHYNSILRASFFRPPFAFMVFSGERE